MKKIIIILVIIAAGGALGWFSYTRNQQEELQFGSRTTPIVENPRFIGGLTSTFNLTGTASTTASWSGGDVGRLMINTKMLWATLTAEFLVQFSDDGRTWYNDIYASSTAELSPTTTFSLLRRTFVRQPGMYRVTSSDSVLITGLRNSPLIRVQAKKPISDSAEDVEVDFFLIKEEQQ